MLRRLSWFVIGIVLLGPAVATMSAGAEPMRRVLVRTAPSQAERALPFARDRSARRARIVQRQVEAERLLLGERHRVLHRYKSIPWIAMELSDRAIERLTRSGLALEVQDDRLAEPFLDESAVQIEAVSTHALGATGSGQTVVVLDTGVDSNHPSLAGQVLSGACFASGSDLVSGDCPGGSTREFGPQAGTPCQYAAHCVHGTAVAGVVAGSSGPYTGVAPDASIFPIQIFSEFGAASCGLAVGSCARSWTSDQIAALEFVYDVVRFAYPVAAVNLSLGAGAWTDPVSCDAANPALREAIDNLRDVGIATVIAAGNGSQQDAISSPGCISSAVSVGSVDGTDRPSATSNRSAHLSFWAPGVRIRSPLAGTDEYRNGSGTSYAAPHVSGALALLRQLMPDVPLPNLLWLLRITGEAVPEPEAMTSSIRVRHTVAATLGPCANLIDDDGDGLVDYPNDPGCRDPFQMVEDPPCDDRWDNDGDGRVDAAGIDWNNDGRLDWLPDEACKGQPWRASEDDSPLHCGLGFELAPLLVVLVGLRRRRSRLR